MEHNPPPAETQGSRPPDSPDRMAVDGRICDMLRRRDQRGMDLLYDAYYRRMVLWANTFLDNLPVAEDLVQELFIDIWAKSIYLRFHVGSIGAFLHISVRNRCLNHKGRRGLVYSAQEVERVEAALEHYNDHEDEILSAVTGEVEALHPRSRQVLRAVYLDGMKYREVAGRYGISVSTVKTLVARALDTIRNRLGDKV